MLQSNDFYKVSLWCHFFSKLFELKYMSPFLWIHAKADDDLRSWRNIIFMVSFSSNLFELKHMSPFLWIYTKNRWSFVESADIIWRNIRLVCSFKTTGPILIKLTSLKVTEKIFKNMIEICTIFKNESIWFQVNRKNHKI